MGKPLGDLNWRLAPLVAFLNAMGGWGFLPLRRFGIPAAIIFFAWLYHRTRERYHVWMYLILAAAIFGSFSLPLTKIGDSVSGHWFNWVWLWILGPIQAAALIPLFMLHQDWDRPADRWLKGFWIHTLTLGTLATLSNTWGYPTHAWFEILVGLSYGGVAAWIINK